MKTLLVSIAVYLVTGTVIAISAVTESMKNGEFSIYEHDEDDEVSVGNIVLAWPVYLISRRNDK